MATKLSTGLRNALLNGQSLREALDDFVIRIYAGTPPTTADGSTATNTLLCTITKNGQSVASSDRSVPQIYKVVVNDSSPGGKTFIFDLAVDDRSETYAYTAPSGATRADVGLGIAQMLDDVDLLCAIYGGLDGDNNALVLVDCRIHGLDMTLSKNNSSTGSFTISSVQSASRIDALQFSRPSSGIVYQPSGESWFGTNVATGVATFFRIVRPNDDGSNSTTAFRIQGTVGTSGADMNLTSTTFTSGAVTSLSSASFEIKATV